MTVASRLTRATTALDRSQPAHGASQRRQDVARRDAEHGGAGSHIGGVQVGLGYARSCRAAGGDDADRQRPPERTPVDQLSDEHRAGGVVALQTHDVHNAALLRERGQSTGLVRIDAERPFGEDVLASSQRSADQPVMIGHLYRDRDHIHVGM